MRLWRKAVALGCGALHGLATGCGGTCPAPQRPLPAPQNAAPTQATERLLGTEHPYALLSADPEGRYVVLCQARKDTDGDGQISAGFVRDEHQGDDFRSYFIEQGAGEVIDAFVRRSESGRFVATIRGGKLVVYDAAERQSITLDTGETPLIAAAAAEQQTFVSFSNDDRLLLFLRRKGNDARAVLHDLTTHQERVVAQVPGKLWRAGLTDDGSWVLLLSITSDTNHDGKVELPGLWTDAATDACARPMSYDRWAADGDSPEYWLVSSSGGEPRRADDFHTGWRDHVLRRAADGALVLDAAGKATEVVPASCGAKVVRAHRSVLLVACMGSAEEREAREKAKQACFSAGFVKLGTDCHGPSAFPLYAYRDGQGTRLGIDVDETQETAELSDGRFLLLRSASARPIPRPQAGANNLGWLFQGEDFVYDVEKRAVRPLGAGRHAEALSGSKILISEADKVVVEDLTSGESRQLATKPVQYHAFVAGHFAFARPFAVDLEAATLLTERDDDILALAQDGRLLVASASYAETEPSPAARYIERLRQSYSSYRPAPLGPLRWLTPRKPEPRSAHE